MGQEDWQKLHQQAVAQGLEFYQDPETGLWVATSIALQKRGHCCDSGCRHCPFPKTKPALKSKD